MDCQGPASSGGLGSADSGALVDASQGPPSPANYADVSLPQATDYADVNVPTDFTQPVWLPPPKTTIEGDLTSLVGSWIELNPDGTPCTPASPLSDSGVACIHLEIKNAASGGFLGTVHGERSSRQDVGSQPPVWGPFAPATNPNVGYPTTVSPGDYFYAEQLLSNVDYQVFDGVFSNGSLTFWFSPLDLWTGWCALQTPSAWSVRGQVKYRCVPQTADQSVTDLGKLALCTSAEDGPRCLDANGFDSPCVCFDDAGVVNVGLPLCGRTVCECSASQCRADLRTKELNGSLQIKAGKLTGTIDFGFGIGGAPPITFQKVTP